MRVLALCTYPVEAAATRYRLSQYVEPLAERGIELDIKPFLSTEQFQHLYKKGSLFGKAAGMVSSVLKRLALTLNVRDYDVLMVQREAMLFGPAFFEWLYSAIGNMPLVLDLDDATYLNYVSPTYGELLSRLKFFGKTDKLIKRSSIVICGNPNIAEYIRQKGKNAAVIPTVVDQNTFSPSDVQNEVPVVGWIGTHSTFPFLEAVFPALQEAARDHKFTLKIVGAGRKDIVLDGVQIDNREWSLQSEVADFQSLDIGLYPLFVTDSVSEEWILGKSGFKAIQYLSVGIPFVMSPVGVCKEIGVAGETHLNANSVDEWKGSLELLLKDAAKRKTMGTAAREYALLHYGLEQQADTLADILKKAAKDPH